MRNETLDDYPGSDSLFLMRDVIEDILVKIAPGY